MLADQLQGPAHPALAMLAAAKAPRQRIVLTDAGWPRQRTTASTEDSAGNETRMDDWGDLATGGSPSFLHYAGMVAAGVALIVGTWLASVHLPELLERLGA